MKNVDKNNVDKNNVDKKNVDKNNVDKKNVDNFSKITIYVKEKEAKVQRSV